MHQMLATATAVATASCSRPDLQTVTITPLPQGPSSSDPRVPPIAPTVSATFTAREPDPPPPDTAGYLVVDMLPAPARCLGIASSTKATGKFRRDAAGLVVDLVITLATSGTPTATFAGSSATAWSAQIISSSFRSSATVALVRTLPTGSNFGVSLQVSCGPQGIGTLAVNVSYTGTASESTPVSLTLHDY
jgi:hypothetical protein